jgi:hypothetical protein
MQVRSRIHVIIHRSIHVHKLTYTRRQQQIEIYMPAYRYTYTHTESQGDTYRHTHRHIHTDTHKHAQTRTHINTHINTHSQTHIHTLTSQWWHELILKIMRPHTMRSRLQFVSAALFTILRGLGSLHTSYQEIMTQSPDHLLSLVGWASYCQDLHQNPLVRQRCLVKNLRAYT